HSHQDHLAALAKAVAGAGVPVVLHAFLDGRDMPPKSGKSCVSRFLGDVEDLEDFSVGTVMGRYFAMDRDKRWDRVQKAYDALVAGQAPAQADDPVAAVAASYAAGKTDEFMEPCVIGAYA